MYIYVYRSSVITVYIIVFYFFYVWCLVDPGMQRAPSWEVNSLSKSLEIAVEGRNKTLYCLAVGRWSSYWWFAKRNWDPFSPKILISVISNHFVLSLALACSCTCNFAECFFFLTDLLITYFRVEVFELVAFCFCLQVKVEQKVSCRNNLVDFSVLLTLRAVRCNLI